MEGREGGGKGDAHHCSLKLILCHSHHHHYHHHQRHHRTATATIRKKACLLRWLRGLPQVWAEAFAAITTTAFRHFRHFRHSAIAVTTFCCLHRRLQPCVAISTNAFNTATTLDSPAVMSPTRTTHLHHLHRQHQIITVITLSTTNNEYLHHHQQETTSFTIGTSIIITITAPISATISANISCR